MALFEDSPDTPLSKKFINSLSSLPSDQLEKRDLLGRTLLHILCITNSYKLLSKLLKNPSIDITVCDYESKWNCLHFAIFHKNFIIARMLLRLPGSLKLLRSKDRNGYTPLDLLSSEGITSLHWIPESIGRIHKNRFQNKRATSFASCLSEINVVKRFKVQKSSHKRDQDNVTATDTQNNEALESHEISEHRIDLSSSFLTNMLFVPERGGSDLLFLALNINPTDPFALERVDLQTLKLHYGSRDYYKRFSDSISLPRIRFTASSSFHRVILTCEPCGNIFVAGQSSNGRLGCPGSSLTSGNCYVPIPALFKEQIIAVDVSDNHSVCLTSSNKIFTWGANTYGQLGYLLDNVRSQTDGIQPTPKLVCNGDIRKLHSRLIGVACSRFHTIAYTSRELYVWGANIGQLGFPTVSSENSKTSVSPSAFPIEVFPHKLEFKYGTIVQVCAIDHTTLVLSDKEEIHAYLHGFHVKITPPLLSKIDESNFGTFKPRALSKRKHIVKLVTQKASNLCLMIYDNGDIGQFVLDTHAKNAAELNSMLNFSTVWKATKRHMRCTDASMGNDGSIIICVADGSVYRRVKRVKVKHAYSSQGLISKRYKFMKIPGLNRVARVTSDPSFGKFFFIRDDIDMLQHRLRKSTVLRDIGHLSPLYELGNRHLQKRYIVDDSKHPALVESDTFKTDFVFRTESDIASESMDEVSLDFNQNDSEHETIQVLRQSALEENDRLYKRYLTRWICPPPENSIRYKYEDIEGFDDLLMAENIDYWLSMKSLDSDCKHYDLNIDVVDDVLGKAFTFHAHKNWISQRCPPVANLFNGNSIGRDLGDVKCKMRVVLECPSVLKIAGDVTIRSVAVLLHFLYTEKYVDVWNKFPLGKVPAEIQRTRVAFHTLSRLFGVVSPMGRVQCIRPLLKDLELLLNGSSGDVTICLDDGTIKAPKYLLTSRSVYFETMFRWNGSDSNVPNICNLEFPGVSKDCFGVVMKFLSGSDIENLFDGIYFGDCDEFVSFCLQMIVIADKLLLDGLVDELQLCIKDFICLDNIEVLLRASYDLDAEKLFENCLWFVYNNLDVLLIDENFFKVDDLENRTILKKIDAYIKRFNEFKQVDKPTILNRDGSQNLNLLNTHPNGLIMQFVSDVNKFNSHFVHPLLWDALGSFKEDEDLFSSRSNGSKSRPSSKKKGSIDNAFTSRRRSSSHESIPGAHTVQQPESSGLLFNRSNRSFNSSTDSFASGSAIEDDDLDPDDSSKRDFVIVSHRRKSNSRRRSSTSLPISRSSSSSGRQGSVTHIVPGSVPVSTSNSVASIISHSGRRVSLAQSSRPSGPFLAAQSLVPSRTTSSSGSFRKSISSEYMPTLGDAIRKASESESGNSNISSKTGGSTFMPRLSQKERKRRAATSKSKSNDNRNGKPVKPVSAPWTKGSTWNSVSPEELPALDVSVTKVGTSTRKSSVGIDTRFSRGNVWGSITPDASDKTSGKAVTSFDSVLFEEKLNESMEQRQQNQNVSLEDIQREEAFDQWWKEESARVQGQMKAGRTPAEGSSSTHSNRRRGGGKKKISNRRQHNNHSNQSNMGSSTGRELGREDNKKAPRSQHKGRKRTKKKKEQS